MRKGFLLLGRHLETNCDPASSSASNKYALFISMSQKTAKCKELFCAIMVPQQLWAIPPANSGKPGKPRIPGKPGIPGKLGKPGIPGKPGKYVS